MKCVYCRMALKLEDGTVKLRPPRFSEWPVIFEGLARNGEHIFQAGSKPSRFSLWWKLRRLYMISYAIARTEKIIGFAGLFDIRLRESARLTFLIFDETERKKGYGSAAFSLLVRSLKENSFVKELELKVDPANQAAIHFWLKSGFREISEEDGNTLLRLSIF